jgi:hypothetical protein
MENDEQSLMRLELALLNAAKVHDMMVVKHEKVQR